MFGVYGTPRLVIITPGISRSTRMPKHKGWTGRGRVGSSKHPVKYRPFSDVAMIVIAPIYKSLCEALS